MLFLKVDALFAFTFGVHHDDLEADASELDSITSSYLITWHNKIVVLIASIFDHLPTLICRIQFLKRVVFHKGKVINPEIVCQFKINEEVTFFE